MNHAPTSRAPVHFLSEGRRCVRVPLASGKGHAELFAKSFDTLTAAGFSPLWSLNSNGNGRAYVKARTTNNQRTVARLITQAGPGQQVDYLDGNPLNLRLDNLKVRRGGTATVDCMALLAQQTDVTA